MLILNEKQYAENLYSGNNDEVKSILIKVGYITRYHLHVLNYDDETNYNCTVQWLYKNHNSFNESYYSNLIADAIKKAYKNPFYHIDKLQITKSELETIASLNNLRAEKVLFVLLCMAKQQSVASGFTNGLVKYSLSDLCKAARISVPSDDREYILYNIVQHGFLGYPKKNNTQCLIVNFINNDDEVVLNLDDNDCQELAYAYLNWKNKGVGFGRCEYCNKLMKKPKTNPRRVCEECSKIVGDIPNGMKVISCSECGTPFFVDTRNTTKIRCDECQSERDKEMKSIRNKKYYESHKN